MGWRRSKVLGLGKVQQAFGSELTEWDGDKALIRASKLISLFSSEPTVWDGDSGITGVEKCSNLCSGSEPTGWDGDSFAFSSVSTLNASVLSPPCGIETFLDA